MSSECSLCGAELAPPSASWEFFLPLEPPSQNQVASNTGGGRWRYKRLRDEYTLLLRAEKNRQGIPDATAKRRVTITRLYAGRGKERDLGNVIGGAKVLLDCMTATRLIVDDAPRWLECHYRQERASAAGVVVRVEDV